MKKITLTWATLVGLAMIAGCGGEKTEAPTGAPEAKATAAATSAATTIASAAPTESASAAPTASAAPEASGSAAAPPAKTFDCGARGQKPCPMQGWMKTVMAKATSSGDGEKLAKALTYVATHVPPGYDTWASIASAGAAKAKAGDIEGAKRSCKECHDAYKEKYKATLRDQPY